MIDASLFPALLSLLTVARSGSVGAAARLHHRTSSAISQQIRRVETHFGVKLLERAGRGVRLTPAGEAAKAGRVPDAGGKVGNAPWYACNPMGFPRLVNDDEPMEFIMLPNRILQLFQSEHRIRMLWTDGRALPSGENLENLGPAWYGHSVAKWNGNALVVNTVGLDDRAWLDNAGNPKSFHARVEETWRRVDSNTLEMQMTLYDPEYYTATYVGSKKIYKRTPNDAMTYFGWSGLFAGITESICAPMNEVEGYNKFRDLGARPAAR